MLQDYYHKKEYSCFDLAHIQCSHLMYSEVAWVVVSSWSQVRLQIILDPDCLADHLSFSYDYD